MTWSWPMKVLYDVPVSRNWYKTVSKYENSYLYNFVKKIQVSTDHIQQIRNQSVNEDIPDEPNCNLWLLQLLFELNNF